jgi:hypothetical protein
MDNDILINPVKCLSDMNETNTEEFLDYVGRLLSRRQVLRKELRIKVEVPKTEDPSTSRVHLGTVEYGLCRLRPSLSSLHLLRQFTPPLFEKVEWYRKRIQTCTRACKTERRNLTVGEHLNYDMKTILRCRSIIFGIYDCPKGSLNPGGI